MDLNIYQMQARHTAIYPDKDKNLVYPALKLAGEAGEVAEKVGKLMRDKGYKIGRHSWNLETSTVIDLAKELGDVLWYIAALASELDITLEYVAEMNLTKLADRQARDKLQGSGDDR